MVRSRDVLKRCAVLSVLLCGLAAFSRQPGAVLPEIAAPALFDTPEADRILSVLQILPPDSPWHEDIRDRPVHPMSAAIVRSIGADAPLGYNLDMNFVIVPAKQPTVNVRITEYPDESDPGPFPIPRNAPIENWPLTRNEDTKALPRPGVTLEQFQREGSGDRHLIIVDPAHGRFHEFWQARLTDAGWQASQASTFDLHTNRLRPERWTSSDAAGLPILPAIVRYVDRSLAAPDGGTAAASARLRYHRFPAACAGGAHGAQTVRHVRRRQREQLAAVDCAGSSVRRPRIADPRQGIRLRSDRPRRGGRTSEGAKRRR